jgi:hypothetical protein
VKNRFLKVEVREWSAAGPGVVVEIRNEEERPLEARV